MSDYTESSLFLDDPSGPLAVADTASAATLIPTNATHLLIVNETAFTVYAAGGTSSVTVVAGSGHIIPAGTFRTFRVSNKTHFSIIAKAGLSGQVEYEGVQTA